jgi:hypothetical protein
MSEENTTPVEETQITFDPKQVEAELVKMAEERAEDPAETAASTYRLYLPYFKAQLPKLSTRALRRLVEFLVLYPLEKDRVGATTEVEREMMELTNTLVQAKFVMILDTYNKHAEEIYAAANAPLTQEQADEVIAQLKAGGASDEDIAAIHKPLDNSTSNTVE